MIQAMRSRYRAFSRNLLALWCVLLIACSFAHIQVASAHTHDAAEVVSYSGHEHASHDHSTADSCSAVQNAPLNQQLLTLLALTPCSPWLAALACSAICSGAAAACCAYPYSAPAYPRPFASSCIAITNSATLPR